MDVGVQAGWLAMPCRLFRLHAPHPYFGCVVGCVSSVGRTAAISAQADGCRVSTHADYVLFGLIIMFDGVRRAREPCTRALPCSAQSCTAHRRPLGVGYQLALAAALCVALTSRHSL